MYEVLLGSVLSLSMNREPLKCNLNSLSLGMRVENPAYVES